MTPAEIADHIIELYVKFGDADYIGEPVSQIEHMCQCAQLAENAGADEEMILAAFFHDIGHLYEHIAQEKTEHLDVFGTVNHETLGADYLRKLGFGERMAKLVASHVDAKRYLVATLPAYKQKLSEASIQTLIMQGGPMDQKEIANFEADPLHKEYIQLRYWDEQAKETEIPLPNLQLYRKMIIHQLEMKNNVTN
jgi:phosphonate degradation associated HDIG domain protein